MLKSAALSLSLIVLCFAGPACKPTLTAAQVKAQADKVKKEERKKQAAKVYQDLVTKFPDSEFAPKAKERLQAIGTPTPKK